MTDEQLIKALRLGDIRISETFKCVIDEGGG